MPPVVKEGWDAGESRTGQQRSREYAENSKPDSRDTNPSVDLRSLSSDRLFAIDIKYEPVKYKFQYAEIYR